MSFNQNTPRTPDQIIDQKAVKRRNNLIVGGLVAMGLAFVTNGLPIATVFFIGGSWALFIAYHMNEEGCRDRSLQAVIEHV